MGVSDGKERLRLRHVSARLLLIHKPIVCLCVSVYVYNAEVMACTDFLSALIVCLMVSCPVQPVELVCLQFFFKLTH